MAKPEQSLEHIAKALQAIAKDLTAIRRLMERAERRAENPIRALLGQSPHKDLDEQEDPTDGI